MNLMHRAVSLLARRGYSRGELHDRLAAHGENDPIESVLDHLEQLDLLNDEEYAYNSASRWMRQQGWGPIKVLQQLARRKVAPADAEAALERVHRELSDEAALKTWLDRKRRTRELPGDAKGIHRLIQSLRRRGFPQDVIMSVLEQMIPARAWRKFQTGD